MSLLCPGGRYNQKETVISGHEFIQCRFRHRRGGGGGRKVVCSNASAVEENSFPIGIASVICQPRVDIHLNKKLAVAEVTRDVLFYSKERFEVNNSCRKAKAEIFFCWLLFFLFAARLLLVWGIIRCCEWRWIDVESCCSITGGVGTGRCLSRILCCSPTRWRRSWTGIRWTHCYLSIRRQSEKWFSEQLVSPRTSNALPWEREKKKNLPPRRCLSIGGESLQIARPRQTVQSEKSIPVLMKTNVTKYRWRWERLLAVIGFKCGLSFG